jgi:hypothetical protein
VFRHREDRGSRWRRSIPGVASVAAVLLVWAALVLPDTFGASGAAASVRVPLEGILLGAILLVLPRRAARVVAVVLGIAIAVLTLLKVLDLGFRATVNRAFDPAADWVLLGSAVGVLADSTGPAWAAILVGGTVVLSIAAVVALALASRRIARIVHADRRRTSAVLGVVGAGWSVLALLGLQIAPGLAVASADEASFAVDEVSRAVASATALASFAAQVDAPDPYGRADPSALLGKLRGKDVLLVFVESYGQVAVRGSSFSGSIDAALQADTRELSAAGYSAESAMLTSPTFGGISWLAHSTLQSGLWVPDQRSYDRLLTSSRLTISSAFSRAGWGTVSDAPSDRRPWPEGRAFYRFDRMYDADNVGYAGPQFGYATMPDQFTLERFRQLELGGGHRPVMAEIDLVSSHTPWTPLPHLVDGDALGNGSLFDPMPADGPSPELAWQDPSEVQARYARSIQYSIDSLVGFVTRSKDSSLVVVLLGDHQPATIVSGTEASHDVPITIIAADPAVFRAIDSWQWTAGMLPDPAGPVWPMDRFRNRFFDAFGSR